MFDTPQKEHAWLEQFVGDWISEGECSMGPGQEVQKTTGRGRAYMLGGLWLILEGEGGDNPDGEPFKSLMTVGYDIKKGQYVGTFIGSVMTHLWPYSGVLDASGKKLPLDSEGPRFDGEGMTKYRDTIEFVDKDHWNFNGEVLLDGTWHMIMKSTHRRA